MNDNDTINDLVQALIYARFLIDNPNKSSAAERAATRVHIDELIRLHSPREEQAVE